MKIKCEICRNKFEPKKEEMYFAHEKMSMTEAITKKPYIYECFDCPECGHQIIVSIRLESTEEK